MRMIREMGNDDGSEGRTASRTARATPGAALALLMHGARGGARPEPANPNWRHGGRSREAVAVRKLVNTLGREARRMADALGEG